MSRRYSFESDPGEREPLDNANTRYPPSSSRSHPQQYQQQMQQYYDQQPQAQAQTQPQRPRPANGPAAHPNSSFNRIAATRRYSRDRSASGGGQAPYSAAPEAAMGSVGGAAPFTSRRDEIVSPISPPQPPQPPPHRDGDGRYWGQNIGYAPQHAHQQPQSTITPGADNFSEAAAGGMAGIALSVAERNARESGLEAVRGGQRPQQPGYPQQAYHGQWQNQPYAREQNPYAPGERGRPDPGRVPVPRQGALAVAGYPVDRDSQASLQPLGAAAIAPGQASPGMRTPSRSPHSASNDVYTDDPYSGYSRGQDPQLGMVNPNDIEDDGDDGLVYNRRGPRTSMLSLGHSNRSGQTLNNSTAAGAAGGAAAGGVMGTLGGYVGRSPHGNGQYNPVHNSQGAYQGGGASSYDLGHSSVPDKSEWLSKQNSSSKKWKWLIIASVLLAVIAGVVCGVVFGVVLKKGSGGGGAKGGGTSSQSADGDTAANGDLNVNSPDIQALMNNPNLHKVFPGMDYTPLNTQYPECIHFPPSQNNITRDVAILTQLTNTIRLYGTDCNQTEMTIHAIRQLKLEDTVKIWMGVWQDNNATTNARQLAQMWNILDAYGAAPFEGVIVANEILFRQQMTAWELGTLLSTVRTNLTAKGISLPVATSDLGDKWDANLAQASDYIMSNIHPFFGGINAKDAADWTWTFWANKNQGFFKTDKKKNVISETGWPTQGGTDCGSATVTNCPNAAVAGIDELNRFMADWVCEALTNGTNYFWFEAFDEPWKVRFNSANQNWEDHWGLLDVNRNLKDGIQIPDCGGKTV